MQIWCTLFLKRHIQKLYYDYKDFAIKMSRKSSRMQRFHSFYPLTFFPKYYIAELENWLPVCKSKPLFLKVLARLNSGISRNHDFSGIYVSKLELTKPNRLNQLLRRDKITPDQFLFWKKTHFKRRSNSSFFFCKIKFHPWWQCLWIRMAVRSVYFFSRYGVRLISLAGITLMPSLAKVSSP